MKRSPLTLLITAVLVVAFLCTILIKASWLIWIPTALALVVVGYLASSACR